MSIPSSESKLTSNLSNVFTKNLPQLSDINSNLPNLTAHAKEFTTGLSKSLSLVHNVKGQLKSDYGALSCPVTAVNAPNAFLEINSLQDDNAVLDQFHAKSASTSSASQFIQPISTLYSESLKFCFDNSLNQPKPKIDITKEDQARFRSLFFFGPESPQQGMTPEHSTNFVTPRSSTVPISSLSTKEENILPLSKLEITSNRLNLPQAQSSEPKLKSQITTKSSYSDNFHSNSIPPAPSAPHHINFTPGVSVSQSPAPHPRGYSYQPSNFYQTPVNQQYQVSQSRPAPQQHIHHNPPPYQNPTNLFNPNVSLFGYQASPAPNQIYPLGQAKNIHFQNQYQNQSLPP